MTASHKHLRLEIEADLQRSPRGVVIYLEGKTDPLVVVGLLGLNPPPGPEDTFQVVNGVGVRGLSVRRGSGRTAVEAMLAAVNGTTLAGKVYGIVDGDGRSFEELAAQFDAPFRGPLFSWKAYCIESLLARSGIWPESWAPPPSWPVALLPYAPYVALGRMHRTMQAELQTVGLHQFQHPPLAVHQPLLDADEVELTLKGAPLTALSRSLDKWFRAEHTEFESLLGTSLDSAFARLNGKWLVTHLAASLTGRSAEECTDVWAAWVGAQGGFVEVKEFWARHWGLPAVSPPETATPPSTPSGP